MPAKEAVAKKIVMRLSESVVIHTLGCSWHYPVSQSVAFIGSTGVNSPCEETLANGLADVWELRHPDNIIINKALLIQSQIK